MYRNNKYNGNSMKAGIEPQYGSLGHDNRDSRHSSMPRQNSIEQMADNPEYPYIQRNGSLNRLKLNNNGMPVPYKSGNGDDISPQSKKVPSHLRRIG